MHISLATLADAHYLKSRLRFSDRKEIEAQGRKVEPTVPASFELSTIAYTVRAEEGGKPLAMYGAAPTPEQPELGTVWMLSTHGISKVGKSFLKQAPQIMADLLSSYPGGLHNIALFEKSNDKNLRWIKAFGFTFKDVVIHNGHPFIYFVKEV